MKCHVWIMNKRLWLVLAFVLLLPALAQAYEGFGAGATGGAGHAEVVTVTSCDDPRQSNGEPVAPLKPGTLRWAAQSGNRTIRFSVACGPGSPNPIANFVQQRVNGTVVKKDRWIYFKSNTTVDGRTAPFPGFQYIGTLAVGGQHCSPRCHNVIITGMIYRGDGNTVTNFALKVERGAHTIVFDRNTAERCGNDCIGISSNERVGATTQFMDSRNITVSRNLLNHPFRVDPGVAGENEMGAETAMLVTNRSRRISVLYNLIYDSKRRNPRFEYDREVNPTDTVFDIRNNLIYKVRGPRTQDGGIILYNRVRGNVVNK